MVERTNANQSSYLGQLPNEKVISATKSGMIWSKKIWPNSLGSSNSLVFLGGSGCVVVNSVVSPHLVVISCVQVVINWRTSNLRRYTIL